MASGVTSIDTRNTEAQRSAKRLGTRSSPRPGQSFEACPSSVKLEHFNVGTPLLQLSMASAVPTCSHGPLSHWTDVMFARMLECLTILRYNRASASKTNYVVESMLCWRRATPTRSPSLVLNRLIRHRGDAGWCGFSSHAPSKRKWLCATIPSLFRCKRFGPRDSSKQPFQALGNWLRNLRATV